MEIWIKVKKQANDVTFPQANSIYIMIKILDTLTYNTKEVILKNINYDITPRQIDYYHSALEYLKLLTNNKATDLGTFIMGLPIESIYTSFVKLILEDPIFYNYYLYKDINQTINLLIENYNYSLSTSTRRSSTVKKWIEWCEIIISDNKINLNIIKSY